MRIANQVVLDEVEEGKFVTMLYLTLDPATGDSPALPGAITSRGSCGRMEPSRSWARGLALGIAPDQQYPEARRRWSRRVRRAVHGRGRGVPSRASSTGRCGSTACWESSAHCGRSSWHARSWRIRGHSPAAGSRTTPPWSSSKTS